MTWVTWIRIHYLECSATSQQQVATFLRSEARRLASARPWTTSLVVCREVKEWEDFDAFDAWVLNSMHDLDELVGLVVFHLYFARWPSLAADVVEGRQVTSYYEESDGRKSSKALPATVQCLDPKRVGVRRIGLRFLDRGKRKRLKNRGMSGTPMDDGVVQWVPIEWLQGCGGVPLLDNVLHQAPHPTIHLIRREDLDSVKEGSYGTVASLLRRNSDYLREVDPLNGKPLALDHLLGVSRLQEMKGFCKELSDMQALQEPALQEGDGWEKMARQMGARAETRRVIRAIESSTPDWWQAGHASIIGERHEWSKPKQEAADRAELTKFVEEKAFKRIRLEEDERSRAAKDLAQEVRRKGPSVIPSAWHTRASQPEEISAWPMLKGPDPECGLKEALRDGGLRQAAPGVTTAESFPWRVYLLFYLVATGILANLAFGIWALHQFARVWHRLRPRWTPKMAGEAEESDQEDLPEWDAIGEAWNMDTAGGLGRVDDTPPRETGLRHRTGREFEHRAQPVAWRQLLDYMTPEMQRNHGTTRPTSAAARCDVFQKRRKKMIQADAARQGRVRSRWVKYGLSVMAAAFQGHLKILLKAGVGRSPIKEVESPRRDEALPLIVQEIVTRQFYPDPVATLAAAVAAAKTASPRNESGLDVSVEAENDGKGPEHGKSSKVYPAQHHWTWWKLEGCRFQLGLGGASNSVYLVQDPTGEILALKRVTLGSLEVAWGGQCVKVNEVCLPTADIEKFVNEYQALKNQLKPEEKPKSGKEELLRALLAEAIGTGMIVIFGCGSVCASLSGAYQGVWQVAAVWGLGVSLAIYATAGASGAHLNPAITLAFQLVRPKAHGMTWLKSAQYVLAQMLGAMLAGALNLLIYSGTIAAFEREQGIVRGEPRSILSASAFGEYFPNPGLSKEYGSGPYAQEDVSVVHALFTEAWGTFILAFVIFGITNSSNKVLGSMERVGVPFTTGMTVAVLLPLYAPITQAGWNPARDFGPRIIAALGGWGSVAIPGPRNGFWIYIVGPCLGAPFGAALAEKVLWR
ncbi:Glycerol uptake facilitator protein [Durusdinium trenchii]|uniref:Glycerol uptake facilitator protein n=1 Tax=Durusdinium trenchii TaxID=1381693 RepID=A0ABP0RQ88_9DINO